MRPASVRRARAPGPSPASDPRASARLRSRLRNDKRGLGTTGAGGPRGRALVLGVLCPLALALGTASYDVGTSAMGFDEERVSYRRTVTASLWSMVDANHRLSGALAGLGHSSEGSSRQTATAQAALAHARASVTRTARTVAALKVPREDGALARRVDDVLASEHSYLAAVRGALEHRGHGTAVRADCAEYELQLRLGRLAPLMPGAWRNVYGAHGLLPGGRWCRAGAADLVT